MINHLVLELESKTESEKVVSSSLTISRDGRNRFEKIPADESVRRSSESNVSLHVGVNP